MKVQLVLSNLACLALLPAAITGLAAGAVTTAVAPPPPPESRQLALTGKLLLIPIAKGQAPVAKNHDHVKLAVRVDGSLVHDLVLHLAQTKEEVEWWAALDMGKHVGKMAVLAMSDITDSPGLALIESSDRERYVLPLYDEALRPQFHFSQRLGWNNDVNGLVYENGEWHLFFQYCPVALYHADKHWGHAVSKDLVHWEELPIALYPITQAKGQCFSGSAVVDHQNTAGFQAGAMPPIIAVFSDFGAGVGEALAYSNDHGRTFTYYEGNPVLKHLGNDPRVIWYRYGKSDNPLNAEAQRLGGHWVLVAYDKTREFDLNMAFYTSIDLKKWTEQSHLPGYGECPEIIELPVDGDKMNTRWVVFDANAQYAVGRFDGRTFTPEHEGKHRVHHGAYFASQTFTNAPDGRCIQMAWARLNLPGMPFSQAFTFPHQLTLRKTPNGIRLFAQPVEEIAKLRIKTHTGAAGELAPDAPRKVAVSGELFEVRAEFVLGQAKVVGLDIGGNRVTHDVAADGTVTIQVLIDRPMIEVCLNNGASYTTEGRGKRGAVASISAFVVGGPAMLKSFEIHELKSIWKEYRLPPFFPLSTIASTRAHFVSLHTPGNPCKISRHSTARNRPMKRHLDFTAGVVAGSALPAALRGLIQHAKRLPVVLMGSTVLGAALGEAADVSDTARALGFDQVLFVKRLTYNSNHYYTEYINSAWKPGGNLCVNW